MLADLISGRRTASGAALALLALLAGCGLDVTSPDLFVLTRVGQGTKLTLLVNDGGTVRCNGGAAKQLSDPMLLTARDLATQLGPDAQRKLSVPPGPGSVFAFTVKLSAGTVSFDDEAAARRPELAQLELFAQRLARGPCGLRSA